MAEILDKLNGAKMAAMKAKIAGDGDAGVRLGVIRTLIGEVEKDSKLEHPRGDLAVLKTELKKRKEMAELYEQSSKADRQAQELAEAKVVSEFLPKAPTEAELTEFIAETVKAKELQGKGNKAMGEVMAALRGTYEAFDGKLASSLVRDALAPVEAEAK